MHFTPEQRDSWLKTTAESPFNRWLDAQVRDRHGALDLGKLHALAMAFGMDKRAAYAHLNPGQQRMNIGNLLRRIVPEAEYLREGDGPRAPASRPTPPVKRPSPPVTAPAPPQSELITRSSVAELLALHGQIMDELRDRGVVRTANSPGGDYAELLFPRAFGWTLAGNSASGHDAVDQEGVRYQIKSRRLARPNSTRQLSALRNLPEARFDWLAGILFHPDYSVFRAVLVPHLLVEPRCRYSDHVKAWIFHLDDAVWALPGVKDVTDLVSAAARQL